MTTAIATLRKPFWDSSYSQQFEVRTYSVEQAEAQSIVLDWMSLLNNAAIQLQNECAEDGWDGYTALPISIEALTYASSLISLLPFNIAQPDVVPEPRGDIGLEWRSGDTKIMTLCVSEGRFVYAAILGKNHKLHGEEPFSSHELPMQVKNILFSHFER